MVKIQNFNIRLEKQFVEDEALPPDDPLGELSAFELGLRQFCYEKNRPVSIQIGDRTLQVFLDPDICMLLEDGFPQQIHDLSQGKAIELEFAESCWVLLKFVADGDTVWCKIKEFGYSAEETNFRLDRKQVLERFRSFLNEVMQLAVEQGYIKSNEKNKFVSPAFPDREKSTTLV